MIGEKAWIVLVAFSFVLVSIASSGVVRAEDPAPWIVTGEEQYVDSYYFLANGIVVEPGGKLSFENCTIEFSDPDGQVGIQVVVEEGGALEIVNSTMCGHNSSIYGQTYYDIIIYGSFNCSQCIIKDLDGNGYVGGLQIYSDDVIVARTAFGNSRSSGLYINKSSPVIIQNFVQDSLYGYYFDGSPDANALTEFSDGNTSKTLIFDGAGSPDNVTVSMPSRANITSAELSIESPYVVTASPIPSFSYGLTSPMRMDCGYWWDDTTLDLTLPALFVADKTNGVVVYDQDGNYLAQVDPPRSWPPPSNSLSSPSDVDFHTSSSNYFSHWILALDGTHIDCMMIPGDGSEIKIDRVWTQQDTYIPDNWMSPVAVSSGWTVINGYKYSVICVADSIAGLFSYDEIGLYDYDYHLTTENLTRPCDVSTGIDRVYVVDDNSHIDVFEIEYFSLHWIGEISDGLSFPTSVEVSDKKIFVTDAVNGLVVFDLDGTLSSTVDEGFVNPMSVAILDSQTRAYVQDNDYEIVSFDIGGMYQPSLDIGCDGDIEWSDPGEFSGTVTLNGSNSRMVEELASHLSALSPSATSIVPLGFHCEGTGSVMFSDLAIEYRIQSLFVHNVAANTGCGVFFDNSTAVYATNVYSILNTQGLHLERSSLRIENFTLSLNRALDLYVANQSYPDMVNCTYDRNKTCVLDDKDTDCDQLSDMAETLMYSTNPYLSDTDGDGFEDGWEVAHGINPVNSTDEGPDSDSDFLSDLREAITGCDPLDKDTDGDGIMDGIEFHLLRSDPRSADTDSDGLPDGLEREWGTNLTSVDSDSDGLTDASEVMWNQDSDADGVINALDNDSDNDNLMDGEEVGIGTNMTLYDTDADGIGDGAEHSFWETLAVGLSTQDSDGDGVPNLLDSDSDDDGLSDGREIREWGILDSDDDSLVNVLDRDSDDDGITDGAEVLQYGTDMASNDSDADGLEDLVEVATYFTSPVEVDTDGDMFSDSDEATYWVSRGVDPALTDTDGDGLRNLVDIDSDNDLFPDGWEVANGLDPIQRTGLPTPPTAFCAYPEDSAIYISWAEPEDDGGSSILRYNIYAGTSLGEEELLANVSSTQLGYWHYGTQNAVVYYYMVSAVTNVGEGLFSNRIAAMFIIPPTEPRNLVAEAFATGITLSWAPPESCGGSPVTSYEVFRSENNGTTYEPLSSVDAPSLTYCDLDVRAEVLYFYAVCAVNVAGGGPLSTPASALAVGSAPTSPRSLASFSIGEDITLSWVAPLSDGGYDLAYNVYRGPESGDLFFIDSTQVGVLSYVDTSVERWATYRYAVSAFNPAGESPLSSAIVTSADGLPYFDDFSDEDLSDWSISGSVEVNSTIGSPSPPCMSLGSSSSTAYSEHRFETQRNGRLLIAANLMVLTPYKWPEHGRMYIECPVSTQYTVIEIRAGIVYNKGVSVGAVSYGIWFNLAVDINLISGTYDTYLNGNCVDQNDSFYNVGVFSGVNSVSFSSFYTTFFVDDLSARLNVERPGPPRNLTAIGGHASILLSWECPDGDDGMPVARYDVYRRNDTSAMALIASIAPVTAYEDSNVLPGLQYYYEVRAVNTAGESDASNEASAQMATSVPPSAPTDLVAAAIPKTGIELTWTAPPPNPESPPVEEYRIYRSTTPGPGKVLIETLDGDSLQFLDVDLSSMVKYYYQVSAVNEAGESPLSNEASARAPRLSGPATSYTAEVSLLSTPITTLVTSADYAAGDDDGDGLENGDEGTDADMDGIVYPTSPFKNDTDGDGIWDGDEVDFWVSIGIDPCGDFDNDRRPCIADFDSDNDGFSDGNERDFLLNLKTESPSLDVGPGDDYDGDGIINILDPDSDNDGITDGDEYAYIIGGPINRVEVFDDSLYGGYGWDKPWVHGLKIDIPLDNGQPVPLEGGYLTFIGVQSGGALFGDVVAHPLDTGNLTDIDGADLNLDGTIDIVAASSDGEVVILWNDENASFSTMSHIYVGGNLRGISTGDFDSDGIPDVAVVDYDGNKLAILFGLAILSGYYNFGSPLYVDVGLQPTCVSTLTGTPDTIWVANSGSTYVTRVTVVTHSSVQRDDFNISCSSNRHHPFWVHPTWLGANGAWGFFTANRDDNSVFGYVDDPVIGVRTNWSNIGLAPWTSNYRPDHITAGDVDGDGREDVIFSGDYDDVVLYYHQSAIGNWLDWNWMTSIPGDVYDTSTYWPTVQGLTCIDLDGDGYDDPCWVDGGQGNFAVSRVLGSFLSPVPWSDASYLSFGTEIAPSCLYVGDVTGDGFPDAVVGHYSSEGMISVHPNGMYPLSPMAVVNPIGWPSELNETLWSYDGVLNDTVSISNVYDWLIDYIERHSSYVTDASDGRVDGVISIWIMLKTMAPGTMLIQSAGIGDKTIALDMFDEDVDDDGLLDGYELRELGSNPKVADTDYDGLTDLEEKAYWDSLGIPIESNADKDEYDNLLHDSDCDNDGLLDGEEVNWYDTNPLWADTDHDGLIDSMDMSPLCAAPPDILPWTDQFEPGMLRFTGNMSTLYYPSGHMDSYLWDWYRSTTYDSVFTRDVTESDVVSEINRYLDEAPDGDYPFRVLSAAEAVAPQPELLIKIEMGGGEDWLDIFGDLIFANRYLFYYDMMKRTDTLTYENVEPISNNGVKYSTVLINVQSNTDQSIFVQFRTSGHDDYWLEDEDRFIVPAFSFALFESDGSQGLTGTAVYEDLALATQIDTNCYQVEMRIPSSAVRTDGEPCELEYVLYIAPSWVYNWDGKEGRYAMDTSLLSIGAVVKVIPDYAYLLRGRQSHDIETIAASLPPESTLLSMSGGIKTFWNDGVPYQVYVCNDLSGETFNDLAIDNPSVQASLVIARGERRISEIVEAVNWDNGADDPWVFLSQYDTSYVTKFGDFYRDVVGAASTHFDHTMKRSIDTWADIPVNVQTPIGSPLYAHHPQFLITKTVDDVSGTMYHVQKTSRQTAKCIASPTEFYTWNHCSQTKTLYGHDELQEYLGKERFGPATNALRIAGISAILATDGYRALLAYEDGDTWRCTFYMAEGAVGILGVVFSDVVLFEKTATLPQCASSQALKPVLKFGHVAIAVVGAIEICFSFDKYMDAVNPVLKRYYLESCIAEFSNTVVTLVPYGAFVLLGWSIGYGLMSWLIAPDTLTEMVCKDIGTFCVFWWSYQLSVFLGVPTACAMTAFTTAAEIISERARWYTDNGFPTICILADVE